MTTAMQWREAAMELRKHADKMDAQAAMLERQPICGVVSASGLNGEPLSCGWLLAHQGPHSWASLPTFAAGVSG